MRPVSSFRHLNRLASLHHVQIAAGVLAQLTNSDSRHRVVVAHYVLQAALWERDPIVPSGKLTARFVSGGITSTSTATATVVRADATGSVSQLNFLYDVL